MNDRLQLKREIALKLQTLLESVDKNLLPEEKVISLGPNSITRTLGEFIATPSMSQVWDYEALNKLDGPKLYRAIAGAWQAGQRSGGGRLLIQPGAGKTTVTTQTGPFAGGERTVTDTRPGSRVHHKVAIASIFRPIEKLPLDRQIDLVEALYERGFMLGNDPSNLISLLDYTHEYAGDNAAHVWGDTVGLGYRPTLTPDMSFEDQLDALIETSIKPQYRDLMRAVGPGTVEYSYQKELQKTFQETIGKPVSEASVDEIKAFNKNVLAERAKLDYDLRDPFDESLVDPINRSTYDIYREARNNQASGQPANLKPLKGSIRLDFDRKGKLEPVNVNAYLSTVAGEELPPGNSSAKSAAKNLVRASSASKMGYAVEFGAGLPSQTYNDLTDTVRGNKTGATLGLANALLDESVRADIVNGRYANAAVNVAGQGVVGALAENALKFVWKNGIAKVAANVAPAVVPAVSSAAAYATPVGMTFAAVQALQGANELRLDMKAKEQGTTKKQLVASMEADNKRQYRETMGLTSARYRVNNQTTSPSEALLSRVPTPVATNIPKPSKPKPSKPKPASKSINPLNEALYIGKSLINGSIPYSN